ncbi:MAG TPA: PKD domain-containing protein [Thermoplasmatales archaeon]|nr:PKD domain-containing protein [Thermoplasmatales archaeon]
MRKILTIFIAILMATTIPLMMDTSANNPPEKPTITGPTSGETGKTYTYAVTSTDPDGDKIFYCFNWGDGNEFCTDTVNSGESAQASHAWSEDGTYVITVTATDENGATSEPATLSVKMPLSLPLSDFKLTKPRHGIYIFGIKVFPLIGQIVIGDINVEVKTKDDIIRVEFLLPLTCGCGREIMHVDTSPPFEWNWNQDYDDEIRDEGFTELIVRGYDSNYNEYKEGITLYKVRL